MFWHESGDRLRSEQRNLLARPPAEVRGGIFNVADTAPALRADVVSWLCEQLGREVPAFDGSTTARRGGAPMPDRMISGAKLARVLGWRPQYADYRAGFGAVLASERG